MSGARQRRLRRPLRQQSSAAIPVPVPAPPPERAAPAADAVAVRYLSRHPGDHERALVTDRDLANRFVAGSPLGFCIELTVKDPSLAGAGLDIELEIDGQRQTQRITLPVRVGEPLLVARPLPTLARGLHYLSLALIVRLCWNHRRVMVVNVVDY